MSESQSQQESKVEELTYLEELDILITDLVECHESANLLDTNDTTVYKHDFTLKNQLDPIVKKILSYQKRVTNHRWNLNHPDKQIPNT